MQKQPAPAINKASSTNEHKEERQAARTERKENRKKKFDKRVSQNEIAYHPVNGDHPYNYHAYHPYIWGPRWHPFGFFTLNIADDAFYLSFAGQSYYYDDGVYYIQYGNGYSVVAPPIGAIVYYLPDGYVSVQVGDTTYYYFGGVFYSNQGSSFVVVTAPEGAIVNEIPEGATDQVINGEDYLLYNNTYYMPISQNGQDAYQVVLVN